MIFKSGKEIREVYLGDVPVSEIYIGGYLVWGGRVPMEGAAVIVLTSDALLISADGVSYTVENAGLPLSEVFGSAYGGKEAENANVGIPTVCAEPYMRHIAPMLAADPTVGIGGADIKARGAEMIKTASEVLPMGVAKSTAGASDNTGTEGIGSGVSVGTMLVLQGDDGRFYGIAAPPDLVKITGGAGAVRRGAYTSAAVQSVPGTAGRGAETEGAYIHGIPSLAEIVGGDGELSASRHTGAGVYIVRGANADGSMEKEVGIFGSFGCVGMLPAPVLSLDEPPPLLIPTISDMRIYRAKVAEGKLSESPIYISADTVAEYGEVKEAEVCVADPACEYAELTAGRGAVGNTEHSALGMCMASATTVTEDDPTDAELDGMSIAVTDILSVAVIDAMKVKI
ncbi:MAG: hypothetical protein NC395_12100 [Prevotella sp.]|nr:hypothetical protein [Prevotella sp.]